MPPIQMKGNLVWRTVIVIDRAIAIALMFAPRLDRRAQSEDTRMTIGHRHAQGAPS